MINESSKHHMCNIIKFIISYKFDLINFVHSVIAHIHFEIAMMLDLHRHQHIKCNRTSLKQPPKNGFKCELLFHKGGDDHKL